MIIAITGPVAAGKTTATRYFSKSWKILDIDKIGHAMLLEPSIKKKLCILFGKKILKRDDKNNISRKKLREIVVKSEKNLFLLNKILHPKIRKKVIEGIKNAKLRKYDLVVDCALVEQLCLSHLFDRIILITASKKILSQRKKVWSNKELVFMIRHQQIPRKPDFIINNSGTRQNLGQNIKKILKTIKKY